MWCSTYLKAVAGLAMVSLTACSGAQASKSADTKEAFVEQGAFSADSAYEYIAQQVSFGPRVPGSEAHSRCVEWLTATLERLGAEDIAVSDASMSRFDGEAIPVRNIFARVNPEAPVRVLLLSHYDSRPWADQETDPDNRSLPIPGANDGASGVGVILEIIRNLKAQPAAVGVDILFTDAEDSGAPEWANTVGGDDGWALGARHFAENLPYASASDYPRYGILFDMVGAKGARFMQEYYSANEARRATARVWSTAARMGLSERFPAVTTGAINDDHLPLIAAGIPTTDIIHIDPSSATGFNTTWHTHADNMENIDRETLDIVGRVALNTIYTENQ